MSELLLTGASGFLGSSFKSYLSLHYRIRTLGRGDANDLQVNLGSNVPEINERFDLVLHCAGKAHSIPKTDAERIEFFNVNLQGTKNLCYALEKSGLPSSFVFVSTVAVYGIQKGLRISEEAHLLATDPYGLSKIQAEQFVLNWCVKHNVICTILRLPLLIGPNAPGNFGKMIKGIERGFSFKISGVNAQKSMVLVSDVARCIPKVSEIGGIYNLTDGYHPTFNELIQIISLQLGKKYTPTLPLNLAKTLAKIGDLIGDRFPLNSIKLSKFVAHLTFDDSKARKSFGWNPSPVLANLKISDTNQ